MAALTRRQVLSVTAGGLATAAVTGVFGDDLVRGLLPARTGAAGASQRTAFGTVSVLGATRGPRTRRTGSHHGGAVPDRGDVHLAPAHRVWSDEVRVDIAVENSSRRAVLLSPGQFRLRVGRSGPSVSLCDTGQQVVALGAGTTMTSWVSFLAPPEESVFGVEYTEAGAAVPLSFRIVPGVGA